MKKNIVPIVCLLLATYLVGGCAGKYADVKKASSKFTKTTEAYVAELDKASDAKSVAKAINSYADAMEKIMPDMQRLSEKYPEMKGNGTPPKGLEEVKAEAEAAGRKMAGSFMKLMPYMNDPEVRKAQERLGAVMARP
ncbi:MAG: hypothetical protein HQ523_08220 [Lentisphaerae bacterium]|nr:hypothetical protein [Lentisphaerota bacterium]